MNTIMLRQIAPQHVHKTKTPYMRSILSMFAAVVIIGQTLGGIAYAEEAAASNCQACSTTSPHLDNYIEFGQEIIKALQTYANQENTPSASVVSGDKGAFLNQINSIASTLNDKAQGVASASYAATLITIE